MVDALGTLKLGLPKGRMQEGVFQLLHEAGVSVKVGARGYRPTLPVRWLEAKILKPQNIVEMLEAGSRDVGFAGADVAIAVHGATDAARASADLICERPGLMPIAEAQIYARRVVRVVRWNFGWAIAYNLLAIPFAIAGAVTPLVASVGMAGSSAIVLLNVMRLGGDRAKIPEPSRGR